MPARLRGLTDVQFQQVDAELQDMAVKLTLLSRTLRRAYGTDWLDKALMEYRRIDRLRREVEDRHHA